MSKTPNFQARRTIDSFLAPPHLRTLDAFVQAVDARRSGSPKRRGGLRVLRKRKNSVISLGYDRGRRVLDRFVHDAFEESKHPRSHGQFASKGAGGAAPSGAAFKKGQQVSFLAVS
jgi:hypothetical protein